MRRSLLLLAPILVLAAVLRFTALDWGLRHPPHNDERSFVASTAYMLRERTLDHRFYEYPALFLYLLLPVQAAAGDGPRAYVAARGLVAAFGVLSVALVGLIGTRRFGAWAGLSAAALLAVSPLEVITAHEVRPDVALASFALVALASLHALGESRAGDVRAGLALGLATSIKYSGVLLAPAYLAARALAPGPRLRGLLLASSAALLVGLLCTPYAWLNLHEFWIGVEYQRAAHYKGQANAGYVGNLGQLLHAFVRALGPLAVLLALAGVWLARSRWRALLPWLVYPLTIVLVFASADLIYERHVIPALGAAALLFGLGVQQLAERSRWLAALLAAAAVVAPLWRSLDYVSNVSGASPRDRVLDWAIQHLPGGALILDTRAEDRVGFRQNGFEVVVADERRSPLDGLLAEHVDAILTGVGEARRWGALRTLYPQGGEVNTRFELKAALEQRRPLYAPVALAAMRWSASENAEALLALADGRPDTSWSGAGPQHEGQWLQADFEQALPIGRLELTLAAGEDGYARDLRVWVTRDGHEWRRSADVPGRGPVEEQQAERRPRSQVLVLSPEPVRGVRLAIGSSASPAWRVAELRIDARALP